MRRELSTQAAADAANAAILASGVEAVNPYKEYADSMLEANVLSLGGKQMPDVPDNQGNTPILEYTGGDDESYTVVGGLDPNNPATIIVTIIDIEIIRESRES